MSAFIAPAKKKQLQPAKNGLLVVTDYQASINWAFNLLLATMLTRHHHMLFGTRLRRHGKLSVSLADRLV